jgi:hypothetical protein
LWRNDFELGNSAVGWCFVDSPPTKLGRMTEAVFLHVVIIYDQLGAQRLP